MHVKTRFLIWGLYGIVGAPDFSNVVVTYLNSYENTVTSKMFLLYNAYDNTAIGNVQEFTLSPISQLVPADGHPAS